VHKKRKLVIETKWFRLGYESEMKKPNKRKSTSNRSYTSKGRLLDVRV